MRVHRWFLLPSLSLDPPPLSVIITILRGKDALALKIVQELVKTVFMSIATLLLLKELLSFKDDKCPSMFYRRPRV